MAEEKKKKVKLSKYQRSNKKLRDKFDALVKHDETSKTILSAITNGENKYLRSHRIETTNYDPKWLTMIEDCITESVNNNSAIIDLEQVSTPAGQLNENGEIEW